jgi:hypothetical protein
MAKKKIETFIKEEIYSFMQEHINDVRPCSKFSKELDWQEYGFDNEKDFFYNIKKNTQDAIWCLTELMAWGMDKNYSKEFEIGHIGDEYDYNIVYQIKDRCFYINYVDYGIDGAIEVKKISKTVVIDTFEKI